MIKQEIKSYNLVSKTLHWILALAIIFLLFLGFFMHSASGSTKINLINIHKSIGISIIILTIIRVIWRLFNTPPKLPKSIKKWEKNTAKIFQLGLYLLSFIMPISGWIMSTASNHIPKFWWWFKLPFPYAKTNYKLAGFTHDIHSITAWVFIGFISIHVLAALKHHFVNKNNILKSML